MSLCHGSNVSQVWFLQHSVYTWFSLHDPQGLRKHFLELPPNSHNYELVNSNWKSSIYFKCILGSQSPSPMPVQASHSFITLLSIIARLSPIPSCFLDLSTVPQSCPGFSDSKTEKYKKYKRPVQVGGAIRPSDAHVMIPHSLREK